MGNIQGNEKQSKTGKSPAKGKHFLRNRKSPGKDSKKHGRKKSGANRETIDREFDKTPDSDNVEVEASDNDTLECASKSGESASVHWEVTVPRCERSLTRALGSPDSPTDDTTPSAVELELNQCYYSAESSARDDPRTLTPAPAPDMPHDDAASSLSDDLEKEEKSDVFDDSDKSDNEKVMGAILSGGRGERLERAAHEFREHRLKASPAQSSFTVSRHRRVELQPVPAPGAAVAAAGDPCEPLHHEAARRAVSASEPPTESNVLRKVASLTLDKHSEPRVLRPKFVPEKLNFQLYEKFEGQMLLNWFLSSVSDNSQLKNLLPAQDLKNLGIHYCTHLLTAGVLRQIPDKDAPPENVFKPNLMYYWSHMEAPVSQPATPGRLHVTAWPHDKDVYRTIAPDLTLCNIENNRVFNQNNNDEIADINEAKVVIAQLKNKLLDLELQLEKLKLAAQIETINKNLEKCFPPDNVMKKATLVNKEVQTSNEFNEISNKPVIILPDSDPHLRTSVATGSSLDVSSVACNTEIINKNIENKTGLRSENIENYCKLNKIRDYEETVRQSEVSEYDRADINIERTAMRKENTLTHSSSIESSSEASFFSINNSTDLISSKQESSSDLVRQDNILKSVINCTNIPITEVLYQINDDKNNGSIVNATAVSSETSISEKTDKPLVDAEPSKTVSEVSEGKSDTHVSEPHAPLEACPPPAPPQPESLEPTTDPPRALSKNSTATHIHIPLPEIGYPPPPPMLSTDSEPPSSPSISGPPPPEAEVCAPPPPPPTPEIKIPPPPPPPPMPGIVPLPPPMPGISPPPSPVLGSAPPPPPMPGMGPPPPPMPGMSPPPPPMPSMGPPPPPMPGMGPPPPPMPCMGPPMPGMGPPMPCMGPPPPPMPGMGPPPPPMPGMGPPPPPMPGMGPPPPPMAGMGPPPPPMMPGPMPPGASPPPGLPPSNNGPVPFPAPPAGGWNVQRSSLRKVPVKPAAPMKPLYWTRILAPPVATCHATTPVKPLWLEIDETNLDNIDEFTDLFSRQVVKAPVKKKVAVKTKIQPVKILDSKRSQNVGILAQSLHVEFSEIENAIYNFDTSVVSLEALQQIYEMRATDEELAQIKQHLKSKPDVPLDKPEAFLHDLSGIPNFAERISCFMFQADFEDAVSTTMHKLDNLKHTCEFLMTSEALKKVFAIILTLGNYMNGGNGQRGQADGFGLEILSKLKDVKSKRSNVTLLHFIVRTYMRVRGGALGGACALAVPEPGDVARAAALDFAGVAAHLAALTAQLAACKEKTKKVIETDTHSRSKLDENSTAESRKRLDIFEEKMTAFLTAAEEKLKLEHENLEECRSKFLATVRFYQYSPKCGKPEECEPKEFFALWTTFCSDFKDIFKKEEQIAIKEKLKEAKKHQEERKSQSLTQPKKEGGLKARLQKISSTTKK